MRLVSPPKFKYEKVIRRIKPINIKINWILSVRITDWNPPVKVYINDIDAPKNSECKVFKFQINKSIVDKIFKYGAGLVRRITQKVAIIAGNLP